MPAEMLWRESGTNILRRCFPADGFRDGPDSMAADAQDALQTLAEVEEAAEDVLSDKQQLIDLDLKRNQNREALSALRDASQEAAGKVNVCFGNMFIKLPAQIAKQMIEKDQDRLNKEINDTRKGLKVKVNRLNKLQGKPELLGYTLCPLSKEEMKAINQIIR